MPALLSTSSCTGVIADVSAAADYNRVAVLKIGDRIDDHRLTIDGHRAVTNGADLHHACDRLLAGHCQDLLDLLSSYDTPTGNGQMPGGKQNWTAGDASVSGVNKMLNTLLTAAGVTKAGGGPTDDFGEPSLPKGIFSELPV